MSSEEEALHVVAPQVAANVLSTGVMPAKKPPPISAASFGGDCYGLGLVKKGVGASPDDDVLLALGFPHILVLTDEAPAKDATDPKRVFRRYPTDGTTLPRAFAARYRAALAAGSDPEALAKALAGDPPPLSEAELAKCIRICFLCGSTHAEADLFVLEGMAGSVPVAEAAVSFLEKYESPDWRDRNIDMGWASIRALYFVLLRVPKAARDGLRARLEALHTRVLAAQKDAAPWRSVQALDVILHGARGVERSGYRDAEGGLFFDLAFADDDPAFVAKHALAELAAMRPGDRARFDTRLAFLGGPGVAEALKAATARFHSSHKKSIEEQLARLA